MTKRLSTRISLRWPPEPPFENTDTLVLSVGNWYVDLRVDRNTAILDWAIAGKRLQDADSSTTAELDSRNAFGVADCGTFSALPNGDDLEVGVMPRPDLPGAPMREYEERQVLARPIGETRTVVKSGGEVSARREEFVQGQGFVVKYSLGPEADKLPTREDIRLPLSDDSLERLVVGGQQYMVRSWEKS